MAQQTSTTASITATDGTVVTNQPINVDNVVRATAQEQYATSSGDLNKYPVIQIDINTGAIQYWFYDLNDEATRDADLAAKF